MQVTPLLWGRRLACVALLLLPFGLGHSQQVPSRVALPLADLVVFPDSQYGVTLLASPNLDSDQGAVKTQVSRLALAPRDVETWVAEASQFLATAPELARTATSLPLYVGLRGDLGRSGLTLVYTPTGRKADRFYLVVHDADRTTPPWRVSVEPRHMARLLAALDSAHRVAVLQPREGPGSGGRAALTCELDRPPRVVGQAGLRSPTDLREGRVWTQFIIDTTGAVELASVQVLLSDGPEFEAEVRRALRDIRYSPGILGNRAVPTLAFQSFSFRVGTAVRRR